LLEEFVKRNKVEERKGEIKRKRLPKIIKKSLEADKNTEILNKED